MVLSVPPAVPHSCGHLQECHMCISLVPHYCGARSSGQGGFGRFGAGGFGRTIILTGWLSLGTSRQIWIVSVLDLVVYVDRQLVFL